MTNNNTFQAFLVDFPKEYVDNSAQRGLDLTAGFFDFLAGLKTEFVIEASMHNIGNEIKFYFYVPQKISFKAEEKAKSLWNSAEIKRVHGYGIFNPLGAIAGFWLCPKMPDFFSISHRMKEDFSVFESCLSGFSEVNEVGEGASFQMICRPADNLFKKGISKTIEKINRGTDWRAAVKDCLGESFESSLENFSEEDVLKSLKFKILHNLFFINARVIASAPSQFQADEIISRFAEGLDPIRKSSFGLKAIKPANAKGLVEMFLERNFSEKQKITLNSRELATIFHFPGN